MINKMPQVGIVTGLLLIILGIVGYFMGGQTSWTAFIPAIPGVPLLISSAMALNPKRLKMAMHIAATFGLLGFLAPIGKLAGSIAKGTFAMKLSTGSMMIMAALCGMFLFLCVKSFIDVRKAKKNQ